MDSSWVLESLEETARIGTWVVNIKSQTCHWSRGTYAIHEEDPNKTIALEEGINYYIEPHRPIIRKCVENGIAQNAPWDVQLQIRTATGKIKWVRAMGEPVVEDGTLLMLRGVFQDIDRKKRISDELTLANAKLELALDSAKIGLWDWDIPNNVLKWDQQMYRVYGRSKENFSSAYEAWLAGVHPEDRERGQREVELALSGEKDFDTEFRIITEEGEVRHIRAYGTVIRNEDGSPKTMLGTNWDITPEKEAQAALEHKNNELQTVFDAIPGLVMHKRTADDVMVRVNKYAAESMGTTVDEMSGRPSKDFYDADLCDKYHQDDLEVVNSGKAKLGIIEEVHGHDGAKFWIRTDKVPYFDVDGKATGIVLCAFDISEQIQTQMSLQRLNGELSQFAYRTSHDLKAPLSSIRGLSQIMNEQCDAKDYDGVKSNIEKIVSLSGRLETLVADLLDLTKAEYFEEAPVYFDFESEVERIFASAASHFDRSDVQLERDFVDGLAFKVSPVRMKQILENLISNGLKYSKTNIANPYVRVGVEVQEKVVKISVADNGIGIAEEYHDQVFQMFKRFSHGVEGSGLGLYLVKRHLDAMDGKISFTSRLGEGSTFVISLPR